MKIKELAEYIKNVNPEAEFQVIVLNYPQKFSLTHGGGDGCTLANCDDWGPMVDEVEHYKTCAADIFPEGITKGMGTEIDKLYSDDYPEEFDFRTLITLKTDDVKKELESHGFYDFTIDPDGKSLEIRYKVAPHVKRTVRIERKDDGWNSLPPKPIT